MKKRLNTATTLIEKEIVFNKKTYFLEIEVHGKQTDESFDHEFGTEIAWGQEVENVELYSCKNENDLEVTNPEIRAYAKEYIENECYNEVEFDFSD